MDFKQKFLSNIRGDIFGGITAGIVALPLALAFGVASGLGAASGLYGAIAVGILAALFGGTPSQISGPTGPMTVVMAAMVVMLAGTPQYAFAAVLLAGLFQILFGVLGLGAYIRYIPYPVVSGFMSGIGVIIIALQALPILGVPGASSVIKSLQAIPAALGQANLVALALGLATIAIVYLSPRVIKGVPGTLVALISMTVVAFAFKLQVPKIGEIPSGLPSLTLPPLDMAMLGLILVPALTLAALGSIDSLLTSLVADNMTRTRHDSNKELVGQGLGNALAGLIGGIPGAGATMRTVVNIKSGGKTGLSGTIHGLVLLAVLLGLGALASHIPLAVLAGILVTVGIGIIDYKGVKHFARVPKADAAVMVVVLVMTVFVDLIQAVAAGLVMASLIFVKRTSDMHFVSPRSLEEADMADVTEATELSEEVFEGVYVVHLEGSLFFGNAIPLQTQIAKLEAPRAVVIDMARVPFLDQSGAYALSDLALDLRARDVRVYLSSIQPQPQQLLHLTGIAPGEIPEECVHPTVARAVQAVVLTLNTRPAPSPGVNA
jgi:SulP family sulfate permease